MINLYIWGVTWEDSEEWARGDAMEDVVREELMACWGSTENCLVVDVSGNIMWNTTGLQIGQVLACQG